MVYLKEWLSAEQTAHTMEYTMADLWGMHSVEKKVGYWVGVKGQTMVAQWAFLMDGVKVAMKAPRQVVRTAVHWVLYLVALKVRLREPTSADKTELCWDVWTAHRKDNETV